ncbi:hypothetical protein MOKP118_41850 [Mycobacterium avium subsp. hominissuis]
MSTASLMPILLVDTDALSDMSPWESLAEAREWSEFFSHIPDAKPRDNALSDLLDLAKNDGCWVAYTSRWGTENRQALWEWLRAHDLPTGSVYMRTTPKMDPTGLAHLHVRVIAKKAHHRRPVFVIHNDVEIAAKLRKRGIAALGAAQMPTTVGKFRDILQHARKVPNTKPTDTRKEN